MQGLHLTADLHGCRCPLASLVDADALSAMCRNAIARVGLTLVDEKYFTFPDHEGQPGGVTGAALLAESHVAIHTWPERRGVTLDVYVCNFTQDNSGRAESLMADLIGAFKPAEHHSHRILRGADATGSGDGTGAGELLLEWLNEHSAYGFVAGRRLAASQSAYQRVEVFDTPQFGRLFRLDGRYMTSERDEFFYHEPLVHPAALAHPAPRRVLVIGGGDGGSTEELLKHRDIESVRVVELDQLVVDIARQYLGNVHRGAFDDPRVTLQIGDGFRFIAQTSESFDLIVLDLTDPDTPARQLYTREFFASAARRLNPGGAMTLHLGSPVYTPDRVRSLLADLAGVFAIVRPLGLHVPLYGAYWGMAVVSQTLDPCALDAAQAGARLVQRGLDDLSYYNADVHGALFALPNFYRQLLPAGRAAT